MPTADPPPADPAQPPTSGRPRDGAEKPRIIRRLEVQRDRHRERPLHVRALYIIVGFTVLLGGVAMLVLPGPAFLVIPIGLALLSLEFVWAETLLERALEQGEIAKRKAAETTTRQRVLTAIAVALGAGALAAWAVLGDIPLLPV
ncbi:MAG: PGPGW domain-containing protein [Solirubrobacteraceae bacterium]